MGAPRNGTLFIRKLGAGVTVSCTGVLEPGDALREIFSFGFLFSGESTSLPCASSAVVKALSFIGCGISSSELSPMLMFCIMGASAEKPCDCPNTDSGESLLGRIEECARMRPPYEGVGETVAIPMSPRDCGGAFLYMFSPGYVDSDCWLWVSCAYIRKVGVLFRGKDGVKLAFINTWVARDSETRVGRVAEVTATNKQPSYTLTSKSLVRQTITSLSV